MFRIPYWYESGINNWLTDKFSYAAGLGRSVLERGVEIRKYFDLFLVNVAGCFYLWILGIVISILGLGSELGYKFIRKCIARFSAKISPTGRRVFLR